MKTFFTGEEVKTVDADELYNLLNGNFKEQFDIEVGFHFDNYIAKGLLEPEALEKAKAETARNPYFLNKANDKRTLNKLFSGMSVEKLLEDEPRELFRERLKFEQYNYMAKGYTKETARKMAETKTKCYNPKNNDKNDSVR